MRQELELKYIAPYTPFGVYAGKQFDGEFYSEKIDIYNLGSMFNDARKKIILNPISRYDDISSKEMNELNEDLLVKIELEAIAMNKANYKNACYATVECCFRNHIDIFRLIENNLAFDVNNLKINPYK